LQILQLVWELIMLNLVHLLEERVAKYNRLASIEIGLARYKK
jgi:hypothetical protein